MKWEIFLCKYIHTFLNLVNGSDDLKKIRSLNQKKNYKSCISTKLLNLTYKKSDNYVGIIEAHVTFVVDGSALWEGNFAILQISNKVSRSGTYYSHITYVKLSM